MLSRHWLNLTDDEYTFSTAKPKTKLDYIWSRPASKAELLSTSVRTGVKFSDHFPVVSEFIVK